MATANTYLKVTELDFDQIRSNLKNYLSTQDQFQDYNFEGSAMATLLDVLAYNTHYNAYYLNMLANEMFLDTAQQRDSVVSRAKELGYLPTSAIGASANVHLTFTGIANTVSQFVIPKNAKFSTTVDDVRYTYVAPEAKTVIKVNNAFATDLNIKEGKPLTHRWTVSSVNPVRYIIPNPNVDTSSITVSVQESSVDSTTTQYTRATNTRQVGPESAVFFLEEAEDGKYEIVFSPGVLGKPVKNGNIVIVDYLVCNAEDTNGASAFSIDNLNLNISYGSATVTTNSASLGGRSSETTESIKFNAPRNYQTQNRAIVANDYERIILTENSDLESVVAFGGEQADPAVYGKVYIGIKPFGQLYSTVNRKAILKSTISDRTPLGVDPVIINPEYTYIIPTITVYYNATTSNATRAQIEEGVRTGITDFSSNNLERFGRRFRFSRFTRSLDNLTVGDILNTDASVTMQKRFTPTLRATQSIIILFNNAVRRSTVTSTQFTVAGFNCYFDDDGDGAMRIYRYDSSNNKVFVNESAGTINYTTGKIEINDFAPTSFVDSQIKVSCTPDRLDIIPVRQQILLMNAQDATITVVGEYE